MNTVANFPAPMTSDHVGSERPISLRAHKILTGCNVYHTNSVIRQSVDFGILTGATSAVAGPEFARAFLDRFQALTTFPQNGLKDDFITRLTSPDGAPFEEVLLEAVVVVEASVAFAMTHLGPIAYAAIDKQTDHTDLIWACRIPHLSRRAAEVALVGLIALLPSRLRLSPGSSGPSFDSALKELHGQARRRSLAPATAVIKLAAEERGIPCEIIGGQHLRLGHGKAQDHFYSSTTGGTSIAAQRLCFDKRLTNRHLQDMRLPVPQQIKVGSVDAARAAAQKLGFPVVIKPLRGSKGRGVTAGLTDPASIAAAFDRAHGSGSDVLVETFVPGVDHRLLVIGGRFVAALVRRPPTITGDGIATVEALVDVLNADPSRDGYRMIKVANDAEMKRLLAQAGLSMTDVLEAGRTVALRSTANVSTGGCPIDVTDEVHPDNRELAEKAAQAVGLDVAGIDFVTTDITRSYHDVGGRIIELNAMPGLDIHIWPYVGKPRNVAAVVLELRFPPETDGRIPIIAVAGDKGTGATARHLDRILRGAGRSVALALTKHAYVNGTSADLAETQQENASQILLRDPEIDTLVTTVSARQTATRGTVLDRFQLAVIMDRIKGGDEALFYVGLDVIQRATTECFVVGAGNTAALERLGALGARRLILVGEHPNDPRLQAHLDAGHEAVAVSGEAGQPQIVLLRGTEMLASFPAGPGLVEVVPTPTRRVPKAMIFAIAAALGLGLSGSTIVASLRNGPPIVPEVG